MKWFLFIFPFLVTSQSFAALTTVSMDCRNADGAFRLVPTAACTHCAPSTPAFDFIGGDGLLASGIPDYEATLPGYIGYDGGNSSRIHRDVLSLIDGGTWTVTVMLPEGFFKADHRKGEVVQATVDSTYDDISEDERDDVAVTCTVN